MDIESVLLTNESEIFGKLLELADSCESWWACVGSAASHVCAPLWGIVRRQEDTYLGKLQYAVVALHPGFGDIEALSTLHTEGALRVVVAPQGSYEPNVYGFRTAGRYTTVVISGTHAPVMFGEGYGAAVLSACSPRHPFALSAESFLHRCVAFGRILASHELADYEKRLGFLDEVPATAKKQTLDPPGAKKNGFMSTEKNDDPSEGIWPQLILKELEKLMLLPAVKSVELRTPSDGREPPHWLVRLASGEFPDQAKPYLRELMDRLGKDENPGAPRIIRVDAPGKRYVTCCADSRYFVDDKGYIHKRIISQNDEPLALLAKSQGLLGQ